MDRTEKAGQAEKADDHEIFETHCDWADGDAKVLNLEIGRRPLTTRFKRFWFEFSIFWVKNQQKIVN